MGRLQYISTAGGSFNTTLAANITADSVIGIKFLSTGYSDERLLEFGVAFADVVIRPNDWHMYWWRQGEWQIESLWTLNEVHEVTLEQGLYTWDNTTHTVTGNAAIPSSPNFKSAIIGNLYEFYIKTNDSYTVHLVGWEENGVVGLKDLVSGTFYQPYSGTWTAGPAYSDNNIIPINKYKLYTSNIQKTYEGSTQINKMYVGNDLVYRAVPTTTPAPTPTLVDYVHTSSSTSTDNYIDTGVYPTVNTTFRIVYKPNALIDSTLVGFDDGSTPIKCSSDSTDYRYFYHRGLNDVTFDFNTSRFYKTITFDSDGYADITVGNNYITDNIAQTTSTGTTQSSMATQDVPIYLNVSSYLDFRSLEIWQNNVKVYDGHAAELNGTYGVYDSVGGTFTTQTYGGNSMTGGNLS